VAGVLTPRRDGSDNAVMRSGWRAVELLPKLNAKCKGFFTLATVILKYFNYFLPYIKLALNFICW
jgi:hypothetical protein